MTPRRIIVHAGFHKTGTTTVQTHLRENGRFIWPKSALVLPGRTRGRAALMAVRYSRLGAPALLEAFADDLHATLSGLDVGQSRKVLISDENLAGRMPGRDGQMAYGATPALMAAAEDVIHRVFGDQAEVIFHFSTRDPESWLRSTYRHNLRTSRLTMDQDAYLDTYRNAADLRAVAENVAGAVKGRVQIRDVSGLDGPEGLSAPLIDLLELPGHLRRGLKPLPPQNIGPDDHILDDLLRLNRSDLSDDDVQAAKVKLMKDGGAS
ncbi:hypothetical protein [Pseudooctadecabacter sp.]|uniref:hypothetical protein n=1 Tax=Pseudooctadecabacter sp. TaxID=1966338 RepID=UPI0025E247AA|nr:hypothetical protein [Pseudooctadecabacter sp.]